MSKEYIFTTKHTVLIEADNEEEAKEIYFKLDDYGDCFDVEIEEIAEVPEQTTMTNLVIEEQEKEEDDSIIEDYNNRGMNGGIYFA